MQVGGGATNVDVISNALGSQLAIWWFTDIPYSK